MRKLVLMLVIASVSLSVSAQGFGPKKKQKENTFSMGIKVGGNLSTMSQPDECDRYDGAGFGYSGGVVLNARFGRASKNAQAGTGLLGVGVECDYKLHSMKTIGTDEKGKENANLEIGYFEVPVALQLYPLYKNSKLNNLYVEAGAAFAGTMSRKPESLTVVDRAANANVTYNLDTENSKLKGMDVRPFAGVGIGSKSGFGLNLRYYMGTSKLAENFNSKISNVELSVAYKFCLGEF